MAPQWKPITYKGQPARQYPDGSIRDDKGRLKARHPKADDKVREALVKNGGDPSATLDKATVAKGLNILKAQKQTERKREAAAEARAGLLRAAQSSSPSDPNTPAEAWGVYAESLGERALLEDNTGHSVSAIKLLGKMSALLVEDDKRPVTNIDKQQVNIMFDAETAELWEARAQLTVEGDVVEIEDSSSQPAEHNQAGEEEQGIVGQGEDAGGQEEA